MRTRADRRFFLGEDIDRHFERADIGRTFDLLERYFSTSKHWRMRYTEYRLHRRNKDETEVFVEFLLENIEPSLKQLTQRKDCVIMSLMRYVIRMKVK